MLEQIIKDLYYSFLESGKADHSEDLEYSIYYQGFRDALQLALELKLP